jgi:hypothetical protein
MTSLMMSQRSDWKVESGFCFKNFENVQHNNSSICEFHKIWILPCWDNSIWEKYNLKILQIEKIQFMDNLIGGYLRQKKYKLVSSV